MPDRYFPHHTFEYHTCGTFRISPQSTLTTSHKYLGANNLAPARLWLKASILCAQEMQEIIARPDSQPAARMVTSQELRRRREATEPSTTSHYASIRLRLEASLSRSVVSSLDADPDKPVRGVLPSEAKFQEVMDVLYFWALGEAYMLHPQLQSDMRCAPFLCAASTPHDQIAKVCLHFALHFHCQQSERRKQVLSTCL